MGSDSRESKSHDSTLSTATILASLSKGPRLLTPTPVLPAPPPPEDLHYHQEDTTGGDSAASGDNIEEAEVSIEPPPTEIVDDIVDE